MPRARRSNLHLHDIRMFADTTIGDGIHGIVIHIIARHVGIFEFHCRAWRNIGQGCNDFVVAQHNELFNGREIGPIQCGSRIGPSEDGSEFGIGIGPDLQIIRL